MRRLLKPVLSRWEIDPPLIGAEEAHGELKPIFESLCERSLLRPATPAGSHTCCECGERRRVDYLPSKGGGQAGFIHCQCGVTPVPEEALLRWRIGLHVLFVEPAQEADRLGKQVVDVRQVPDVPPMNRVLFDPRRGLILEQLAQAP